MMAAQRQPVLRPDRQGKRLPSPVAAIGIGVIEGAARRQAVPQRSLEARTNQELEGGAGTKVGRQRPGPMGQAHALADHPATASPGVIISGVSGTRRVSIMSIRPQSCITATITPT
jgi:hypothetical protein